MDICGSRQQARVTRRSADFSSFFVADEGTRSEEPAARSRAPGNGSSNAQSLLPGPHTPRPPCAQTPSQRTQPAPRPRHHCTMRGAQASHTKRFALFHMAWPPSPRINMSVIMVHLGQPKHHGSTRQPADLRNMMALNSCRRISWNLQSAAAAAAKETVHQTGSAATRNSGKAANHAAASSRCAASAAHMRWCRPCH